MLDRLDIFESQETIKNLLDQSKEFMENQLTKFEKSINGKNGKQYADNNSRIMDEQHARNRKIIMEIIATSKIFRKEIRDTFQKLKDEEMEW